MIGEPISVSSYDEIVLLFLRNWGMAIVANPIIVPNVNQTRLTIIAPAICISNLNKMENRSNC